MTAFSPCAIIPSHNHSAAIGDIVLALREAGLAVIIIDDGSAEPARSALAMLRDAKNNISVHRLEPNAGKGAAVMHGFRLAAAAGYTHALQIDADGQHDVTQVPKFLALARAHPQAVIAGIPIYDRSAPLGRVIGRYVTHVWVWIETLSLQISDSMCGFRLYPLGATCALLDEAEIGARMEFDTEIMVRLFWRGVPVIEIPVRVIYPAGNTSNFRLWRENWRISCMHTRLVLRMLVTFPAILRNRPRRIGPGTHWAALRERGARWGLGFVARVYRVLGRRGCLALMAPVVFYFYLTGGEQRRASRQFLTRAFAAAGIPRAPGFRDGLRHFMTFTGKVIDSFAGWIGGIPADRILPRETAALDLAMADPRGALFIVSHLGNVDLARALLDEPTRRRLLILVHTKHAENFSELLRQYRPEAAINTWQVTELGPEAAIELQARIEQGAWIVIAGDRVPIGSHGRVASLPFLGADAPFSHGPYILAALLDCPVYTLFCVQEGDRYGLYAAKLADRISLPRQGRDQALAGYARLFADRLAEMARRYPWQWYNFFDFWNRQPGATRE